MYHLASGIAWEYTNNSQKVRIMSESWALEYIFCPNCWKSLFQYGNNKPVADFYCRDCEEDYELKSAKKIGDKVNDGAYETMIMRIQSNKNPNFLFLDYSWEYEVLNFIAVPKFYFTSEIIEKRKPLSSSARRAGWTGCNILLWEVPKSGKISYIQSGNFRSKDDILKDWQKVNFLKEKTAIEWRGWVLDIMSCVEKLRKNEFTLQEIYDFESFLKQKHPDNNFIRDKIRQQLQFLRDKWYLEFTGSGKYRVL